MPPLNADFAVIGGGVVGLSIANALVAAVPQASVVVFDKEQGLAEHASGRNSGVLHAGFYYAPDSLKARLTRRGNQLLHQFCADNGIPVRHCGKVVVAQSTDEIPALLELHRRAQSKEVPVELVDELALREIESLARTCGQALGHRRPRSHHPSGLSRRWPTSCAAPAVLCT